MMLAFLFLFTSLAPVFAEADKTSSVSPSGTSAADAGAASAVESDASGTAGEQAIVSEKEDVKAKDDKTTDGNVKDDKGDKNGKDTPSDSATAAMASSAGGGSMDTVAQSTTKQLLPEMDKSSGSLNYNYPIVVPPGRNGMQPDPQLNYNNQDLGEGSFFGAGWSINIPYIERINRKGVDNLYSENYFNSSLSGELFLIEDSQWGAKMEDGTFLKYAFTDGSWTAKDKKGVTYKFGSTGASRQDDAVDGTKIFKWMLEEVRDTNDNYIRYEYFKDAGQIYPSRIVYTGNGATDGVLTVDFLRQARTDMSLLYKTGFNVRSNYRINEIDTKINGSLAHKYVLTYGIGANGSVTILNSITETGYNESGAVVVVPATTFEYQGKTTGWTEGASWVMPTYIDSRGITTTLTPYNSMDKIVDINGDGLVDIMSYREETDLNAIRHNVNRFFINNGHGWTQDASWVMPTYINLYGNTTTLFVPDKIADINGDGLPDLLSYREGYDQNSIQHHDNRFFINNGHGWTQDTSWSFPLLYNSSNPIPVTSGILIDLNGDGLVDLMNTRMEVTQPIVTRFYLNNGHGWTEGTSWAMPTYINSYGTTAALTFYDSMDKISDINGDGLPDIMS